MRLSSISLALLLSPLALATSMKSLNSRQSPANILARAPQDDDVACASDEKRCGRACVNQDYNCCPDDVSGGCPSDEVCQEDNGRWGCCPEGDDCSWDDDDDNNNDDDDGLLDRIENVGDNIQDGWNDFWNGDDDDAAGMLKPGVGVALLAAVLAVGLPF